MQITDAEVLQCRIPGQKLSQLVHNPDIDKVVGNVQELQSFIRHRDCHKDGGEPSMRYHVCSDVELLQSRTFLQEHVSQSITPVIFDTVCIQEQTLQRFVASECLNKENDSFRSNFVEA